MKTLWSDFMMWETTAHLGDIASIVGLLVSIIGFALTLAAAIRAEKAASRAVRRLRLVDSLVDYAAAIATIEEIRRFHRLGQWAILPDRYASLRRSLVAIKTIGVGLTNEQRTIVQRALASLQSIERTVEKGMHDPKLLDGARFNVLLAKHADGLVTILTELKSAETGVSDGKAK